MMFSQRGKKWIWVILVLFSVGCQISLGTPIVPDGRLEEEGIVELKATVESDKEDEEDELRGGDKAEPDDSDELLIIEEDIDKVFGVEDFHDEADEEIEKTDTVKAVLDEQEPVKDGAIKEDEDAQETEEANEESEHTTEQLHDEEAVSNTTNVDHEKEETSETMSGTSLEHTHATEQANGDGDIEESKTATEFNLTESTELEEEEEESERTASTDENGETPVSGCDDPTHEHKTHDVEAQHREHLEWNAKQITQLMSRLTQMLEVPAADLNEYRYITALRSPDGSLYVPHHHGQSTRKHLATLLGFAEEIIVSKNALASAETNIQDEEKDVRTESEAPAEQNVTENSDLPTRPEVAENMDTPASNIDEISHNEADIYFTQESYSVKTSEEALAENLATTDELVPTTTKRHIMEVMEDVGKFIEQVEITDENILQLIKKPNFLENLSKPIIDELEAVAETHLEKLSDILQNSTSHLIKPSSHITYSTPVTEQDHQTLGETESDQEGLLS